MKTLALSALLMLLLACISSAQIYRLAEMNTEQIRALDRQKTVILMPGGVIEQHGPYMPAFTDGYMNEWWTERLAEAIAARPGWSVVIFPMVPLGDGGANEIGHKYVFPGSYGVRVKTLRAVYMDFANELGEQGFRWVFVIQNHGSPLHNLALDQAGDYFRDTYNGRMVNLFGLEPAAAANEPKVSEKENGIDIHAGASETSRMLFIKPGLVDMAYKNAKPFTVTSPADFGSIAAGSDWPGYFGSPRLASAAFGAQVMNFRAEMFNKVALSILDGADDRAIPRYADHAMKEQSGTVKGCLEYDAKVEKRQNDWLRKKGID